MNSSPRPINNGKYGLWGYAAPEDPVRMVIPASFECADHFNEGLAAVRLNGRWGYVDTQGDLQISAQFDAVGPFHQGLAEVILESRAGVIDRSGAFVISPKFNRAIPWTKDVVLAQETRTDIHPYCGGNDPLDGLVMAPGYSREIQLRFGLLSTQGRWLFPQVLGRSIPVQSGDLHRMWSQEVASGKWGLIAPDGMWVVEPFFSEVKVTKNGLSVVNEGSGAEPRYGAMRIDGTWLIEPGSFRLIMPYGQYVRVFDGKQQGLINDGGQLIAGRMFDRIDIYDTDGIYVVTADGIARGLNQDGELIPDPRVGKLIKACPSGLQLVSNGDRKRILTATGAAAIPHEVDLWDINCDRPTLLMIADKWTYLYPSGALMHDPAIFESALGFIDGLACVCEHGLWGLIDERGSYIIEPRYQALSPIVYEQTLTDLAQGRSVEQPKGLFKVYHHGRTFAVRTDGVEQELPQRPLRKMDCVPLRDGTSLVHENGMWGLNDEDGAVIVPPVYRALDIFRGGVAWIAMDDRKMWVPIGPDGKAHTGNPAPRVWHCPHRMFGSEPKKLHDDPYESSVLWAQWWLEALAEHRPDQPPYTAS